MCPRYSISLYRNGRILDFDNDFLADVSISIYKLNIIIYFLIIFFIKKKPLVAICIIYKQIGIILNITLTFPGNQSLRCQKKIYFRPPH